MKTNNTIKFLDFVKRRAEEIVGLLLFCLGIIIFIEYIKIHFDLSFIPKILALELSLGVLPKWLGAAFVALPLLAISSGIALITHHKNILSKTRLSIILTSFLFLNLFLFHFKLLAGDFGLKLNSLFKNLPEIEALLKDYAALGAIISLVSFLTAISLGYRKNYRKEKKIGLESFIETGNNLSPLVENLKNSAPPPSNPHFVERKIWQGQFFSLVINKVKIIVTFVSEKLSALKNLLFQKKIKQNIEQRVPNNISPIRQAKPAPVLKKKLFSKTKPHKIIKTKIPPFNLISAPPKIRKSARQAGQVKLLASQLDEALKDFKIQGEISDMRSGPVVSLFEFLPAAGIKSSRIIGLSDDLARSMSAMSARIANIPGQNAIGIEVPNSEREDVHFAHLLNDDVFKKSSALLPIILGSSISGEPIIADLATMPHLLVAGTTGSGKSVAINAMILSLLYKLRADECALIMIDPKMLELSVYQDIPHLLTPVVTDPKKAVAALKWVVAEMERRYQKMSALNVRNIGNYNEKIANSGEGSHLPFIVVIIDEMADLMMVAGKEIEAAVQRLAQMARAAGIHLIAATQRPSVDVITGTIKANFPTRISFQVTSRIDSRTILGEGGAEQLLGKGDMLWMQAGGKLQRVHGPFVSDSHVEEVANFLRENNPPPIYHEEVTVDLQKTQEGGAGNFGVSGGDDDTLYFQAVDIVQENQRASTSFLQRKLQIGYNRAAKIIEQMEENGLISAPAANGKRVVLSGEKYAQNSN